MERDDDAADGVALGVDEGNLEAGVALRFCAALHIELFGCGGLLWFASLLRLQS
jgi:hypothetical protein